MRKHTLCDASPQSPPAPAKRGKAGNCATRARFFSFTPSPQLRLEEAKLVRGSAHQQGGAVIPLYPLFPLEGNIIYSMF